MMNKKEFLHLKSGTDVRGTAVETAEHGVQLTDETVQKICVGFYLSLIHISEPTRP